MLRRLTACFTVLLLSIATAHATSGRGDSEVTDDHLIIGSGGRPRGTAVTVPFEYPTIAEAIAATTDGDTILVYPGVYYESNLDLGAGVTLVGVSGRDSTTIDAGGGGFAIRVGYASNAGRSANTRIEGFTLAGASDSAVRILSSSPTITDCTITGNTATTGAGMHCSGSSPAVSNTHFIGNHATSHGGGIYCSSSSPMVSDCVFWDNSASQAGAAYLTNYSDVHFIGCTFSDNSGTYCSTMKCDGSSPIVEYSVIAHNAGTPLISCETYGHPVLARCVIFGNDPDDELCGTPSANIFSSPLMCDHAAGDLAVCAESPCLPENNVFGRLIGALGLGECSCAPGTTIAVPLDHATITEALAASGMGDTVLVAPGVYCEHDLIVPPGVRLVGVAGPESTTVDAQGMGPVVLLAPPAKSDGRGGRTIEGLTITGGSDSGVKIAGGTVTLSDCVVSENSAADGGGISAESSGLKLESCVVSDNAAWSGGGVWVHQSFLVATDCSFTGNDATTGGGVRAQDSSIEATQCSFSGNEVGGGGGGVWAEGSPVNAEDSSFSDNTAGSGGGIWAQDSPVSATECSFAGNTITVDGGGIRASGSHVTVTRSSFEGNTTSACEGCDGGAVMGLSSEVILESSDFAGNTAASGGAVCSIEGGSLVVSDCTFVRNDSSYDNPYEGGGAIYCYDETSALVLSSTFRANSAFRGGALHMRGLANADVTGCTFVKNSSSAGSTVFVRGSAVSIENSILAFGLGGTAVQCATGTDVTTHHCDIFGNAGGDSLCGEYSLNIFSNPAFCDTTGLRFYLQDCSPCVGAGSGGADIGAWGVACPCDDPSGVEDSGVSSLVLLGCAPNPSRSGATVYYRAHERGGPAELRVFDVSGRLVATVDGRTGPGVRAVTWDGRDSAGHPVASGTYFYKLSAAEDTRRGRLVVLR
jgi:predicted outer membrane repeat protein